MPSAINLCDVNTVIMRFEDKKKIVICYCVSGHEKYFWVDFYQFDRDYQEVPVQYH